MTDVGKAFGDQRPTQTRYGRWLIYRQTAHQAATAYTVLDAIQPMPDLGVTVAVRIAWPHLDGAPAGRDADMERLYRRLLDGVSGKPGAYVPAPGEVVRRPTAQP